jgi:hypothetical protein
LTLTLTLSRTAGEGREAGRGKAEGEILMVFEAPGMTIGEEVLMRKQAVNQTFENNSMEVELEGLRKSIVRWTVLDGLNTTAISALSLSRRDAPTDPMSHMYEPSICLIAQGAKRVLLGDDTFVYDAPQPSGENSSKRL